MDPVGTLEKIVAVARFVHSNYEALKHAKKRSDNLHRIVQVCELTAETARDMTELHADLTTESNRVKLAIEDLNTAMEAVEDTLQKALDTSEMQWYLTGKWIREDIDSCARSLEKYNQLLTNAIQNWAVKVETREKLEKMKQKQQEQAKAISSLEADSKEDEDAAASYKMAHSDESKQKMLSELKNFLERMDDAVSQEHRNFLAFKSAKEKARRWIACTKYQIAPDEAVKKLKDKFSRLKGLEELCKRRHEGNAASDNEVLRKRAADQLPKVEADIAQYDASLSFLETGVTPEEKKILITKEVTEAYTDYALATAKVAHWRELTHQCVKELRVLLKAMGAAGRESLKKIEEIDTTIPALDVEIIIDASFDIWSARAKAERQSRMTKVMHDFPRLGYGAGDQKPQWAVDLEKKLGDQHAVTVDDMRQHIEDLVKQLNGASL